MDFPALLGRRQLVGASADVVRITPSADPTDATVEQVRRLVGLLPHHGEVPLFVFDAGYDGIAIGHDLAESRVEVLCRIRDDRVFYTDPPARSERPTQGAGRPLRHGHRSKCSQPTSWQGPDADHVVAADPRYGQVRVQAWHDLHPRLAGRGHWAECDTPPIVKGTVIRVDVEHLPKGAGNVNKTLWLWWSGPGVPDLDRCFRAYLHRFDKAA